MNNYYVYAHYKPDSDIPFYIGKGIGKRAWEKCKYTRSDYWNKIVNKYGYRVELEFENLSETDAFQMEQDMIKMWGRADLGLGPLINMTDGGDGMSGHIQTEETRKKISGKNIIIMVNILQKKLARK